jgi:hypothetical protein
VRILLVLGLMGAAFAGGWWLRGRQASNATANPVNAAAERARVDACRDDCEQRAILEKRSDEWLRACRTMCGGVESRPYEPIRSISKSPVRPAAPPAVQPRP